MGCIDGYIVGCPVGCIEGLLNGCIVGNVLGCFDGLLVGGGWFAVVDGWLVGGRVGENEGP